MALQGRLEIEYEDICSLAVDAIVNPAHPELLGGGGLDGRIHDVAGPQLLAACRTLGGCEVGDAKVTCGFRLPSRWVIHTVGPVWSGGMAGEDHLLASCYRRCLEEAAGVGARTVALPAISTGLHRFPLHRAAAIAVRESAAFIATSPLPEKVIFAVFDASAARTYAALLEALPA